MLRTLISSQRTFPSLENDRYLVNNQEVLHIAPEQQSCIPWNVCLFM